MRVTNRRKSASVNLLPAMNRCLLKMLSALSRDANTSLHAIHRWASDITTHELQTHALDIPTHRLQHNL